MAVDVAFKYYYYDTGPLHSQYSRAGIQRREVY